MALSVYDQMVMSQSDQDRIKQITDMYDAATSKEDRDSLHNLAESIRSKYGYSGSATGAQYLNTGFTIPQLGEYESPYTDTINQYLSKMGDYEEWSWNPDEDESYQAFLTNVNKKARQTYNDTIAGTSVGTGGRPNSWAATVAAQAQGNMLLDATAKMSDFENSAYAKWEDTKNYNLQELEAVMGLDDTAYNRFMDEYNTEVQTYNSAVTAKRQAISNAMERTELNGFVSNADATVLGVEAGTPSQTVAERTAAMQDYLEKAKIDLQYSKSSSSGGGSKKSSTAKSSYTATDIKTLLKIDSNGETSLSTDDIGQKLTELYNEGSLTDTDYNKYMNLYGGTVPQSETSDSTMTQAEKDALNATASQGRVDAQTKQGLVYLVQQYQNGKITLTELNNQLKKAGYVYNTKTKSVSPI